MQQPIEEDEAGSAALDQGGGEVTDRAQIGRQLDRDRQWDSTAHGLDDLEVARLDVATRFRQIGRDMIHVQLQRRGAGLLDLSRIIDPSGPR